MQDKQNEKGKEILHTHTHKHNHRQKEKDIFSESKKTKAGNSKRR